MVRGATTIRTEGDKSKLATPSLRDRKEREPEAQRFAQTDGGIHISDHEIVRLRSSILIEFLHPLRVGFLLMQPSSNTKSPRE